MRFALVLATICLVAVGCGFANDNGPYTETIAPGLHPRLTAADAVRIAREYLDAQVANLLAPDMKTTPHVTSVVAVTASDARAVDGCIPQKESDAIVWVTMGDGDYINAENHPWSSQMTNSTDPVVRGCSDNGTRGTIVVDDASGSILGVYPVNPLFAHPTPAPM
jgi:hypothetical protein